MRASACLYSKPIIFYIEDDNGLDQGFLNCEVTSLGEVGTECRRDVKNLLVNIVTVNPPFSQFRCILSLFICLHVGVLICRGDT